MTILNAHYDGKQVVLDDPIPADLQPNTRVQVIIEAPAKPRSLARIAAMATETDLPRVRRSRRRHSYRELRSVGKILVIVIGANQVCIRRAVGDLIAIESQSAYAFDHLWKIFFQAFGPCSHGQKR